ncbi:Sucrase/ferredoxin-like protein [Enhygromyxa salina]|uniref:Sucrase/ferredoxin-like protein n=1 Tax=Enhygromyxa salina TaxID=215803 RepID=A0A2S9XAP1_9BACT|nr:sucrase ferredoxin [Enhygromyxa salina]PRP89927.1 Sucrase/ferredoxin-like protein [Enhygromyxa salina]
MAETVEFCRELALDEPLAGTANDAVTRWILVEDCARWGAKVPRDSQLPLAVREWLLARNAEPGTRVQLIRRPGSGRGQHRKLFICEAPAAGAGRRLIELELSVDDIPSLDPDALLARAPGLADPRELASLWLVCTHGTRDRCCAKWGMATWEALGGRDSDRVWQCSHLGGHRFAPTFLTLPSGLLWGRFDNAELGELARSLSAGRLSSLASLRGRCSYPRPVQAAECLVRAREGLVEDDALVFAERETLADGADRVTFTQGSRRIEIEVEKVGLGFASPGSCGDPAEPRMGYRERALKPR